MDNRIAILEAFVDGDLEEEEICMGLLREEDTMRLCW